MVRTPKYPQVKVRIIDLVSDERNLPELVKRCCAAAAEQDPFIHWTELAKFNMEVLAAPNWTIAWGTAVEWFDAMI